MTNERLLVEANDDSAWCALQVHFAVCATSEAQRRHYLAKCVKRIEAFNAKRQEVFRRRRLGLMDP